MYYTYTAAVLMVLLHDAAADGDDDGDGPKPSDSRISMMMLKTL